MMKYSFIIFLFPFFIITPSYANSHFAEIIKNIESIDISSTDTVEVLEEIISENKFANLMKTKELLNNATLKQLLKLKNTARQKKKKMVGLLIKEELQKTERKIIPEYNYIDDILINTKPIVDVSCLKNDDGKPYIQGLNPGRLHFDYYDLSLTYEDLNLEKVSDKHWRANIVPDISTDKFIQMSKKNKNSLDQSSFKYYGSYQTKLLWKYRLQKEMFLKPRFRLWNQKYEETTLHPYYYDEKVFLQNFYRIFCFDALSGELLWTFAPKMKSGAEEQLVHFMVDTVPEHSYQMTVDNSILYAEVAGVLVAIDISSDLPNVAWELPLAQYVLASKPYIVGEGLFVSLINKKGELWGALLDKKNGKILWDSFIGIATAICPASNLVIHDTDRIYFVSNRGAVVVFEYLTGKIAWILKYETRKYSIADIWFNSKEKQRKDFIRTPFDTSYISIVNGTLLFKPRDSRFVYLCDKSSGEVIWRLLLDNVYILTLYDNKMFMLKDEDIISIDFKSGKENTIARVSKGELKGVIHLPSGQCLFKVDTNVYNLIPEESSIVRLIYTSSDSTSWLKGIGEKVFFESKEQFLFCFGYKDILQKTIRELESLKREQLFFERFIKGTINEHERAESFAMVSKYIKREIIPPTTYTELVSLSKRGLDKSYIDLFANKMCLYKDIYLRVNNLLKSIYDSNEDNKYQFKKDNSQRKEAFLMMPKIQEASFILAEGQKLRTLNIKYDTVIFPYFLVLKNDQLVCVKKEDGEIVWSKFTLGSKMGQADQWNGILRATLYDNVLAIFDGINLFGLNADTGSLLWCHSVDNENPTRLLIYLQSGIKSDFLYDAAFGEECVMYFKKGFLYFIEPKTGYCYSKVDVSHRFVAEMKVDGDFLVCFYLPAGIIESYNYKEGKKLQTFDIHIALSKQFFSICEDDEYAILKKLEQYKFDFCVKLPYCYLQLPTGLWCFNFTNNDFSHYEEEFIEQGNIWQVERIGERIVSFHPFWKIIRWDDGLKHKEFQTILSKESYNGMKEKVWESNPNNQYLYFHRGTQYLHWINNKIICLKSKEDGYYAIAIDAESGKELWETFIGDFHPKKFWHISNSVMIDNNICFTVTVKDNYRSPKENLNNNWLGEVLYVHTWFLGVDLQTGELIKKIRFPLGKIEMWKYPHHFNLINDVVVVNENDERLRAERIK